MLDGGSISARELLDLEPGHVVIFDHPVERPVKATLNDREKWVGTIAAKNNKLAFQAVERIETKP